MVLNTSHQNVKITPFFREKIDWNVFFSIVQCRKIATTKSIHWDWLAPIQNTHLIFWLFWNLNWTKRFPLCKYKCVLQDVNIRFWSHWIAFEWIKTIVDILTSVIHRKLMLFSILMVKIRAIESVVRLMSRERGRFLVNRMLIA